MAEAVGADNHALSRKLVNQRPAKQKTLLPIGMEGGT
jgi:hypothetical protein